MSDFEFVSVLVSIVVGLGMTRVLSGLAAIAEHRAEIRIDWVSVGWASGILVWQLLFWVGTVNSWRQFRTDWTLFGVAPGLLMAIALFFASALILPSRVEGGMDLAMRYEMIRRPLFLLFMSMAVFEVLDSLVPGVQNLVGLGPMYWSGQASIFVLGLVGLRATDRRVHNVLLGLFLVWLLFFAFSVNSV